MLQLVGYAGGTLNGLVEPSHIQLFVVVIVVFYKKLNLFTNILMFSSR